MNRIDRLMAITLFLQGRRLVRAEDLAGHFEISLRTVYRDVSALSEAGVPIVAEAGVGYTLMKGYRLPPIMFTSEEASALAIAGLALVKSADASLEASMNSALLKIRAALPEDQKLRLERIEKSVTFLDGGLKDEDKKGVGLLTVQAAVVEGKLLTLRYRAGGRGEITERKVEPLGLVFYAEKWHLIGWCRLREDIRDFRLDRIENLEMCGQKVSVRQDFDIDSYTRERMVPEELITMKIRFSHRYVDRAKREWSLGVRGELRESNGSVLTMVTGDLDWMVGWLLSFRGNAEVLEPVELKERLAREAERLAGVYGNGVPSEATLEEPCDETQ